MYIIKIMKNICSVVGLVIISSLFSLTANADIYKCTNAQGNVIYNDKPCVSKATEKKMKTVKDPGNITSSSPPSPEIETATDKYKPTDEELAEEEYERDKLEAERLMKEGLI
jgi:hypothetical protein